MAEQQIYISHALEKRFDGVRRRVVDFLKKRHGARDE